MSLPRPTKEQLRRTPRRRLPDRIRPHLKILFCGINPGLYSAAIGWHFARPGNRFWRALHMAGYTPRILLPAESRQFLALGYGLTDIVPRPTARADEISLTELRAGLRHLERKVRRYRPRWIAFLGITAYRRAFQLPHARLGPQKERFGGALVWVLPNPSGLNARYQSDVLAKAMWRLRIRAARTQGKFLTDKSCQRAVKTGQGRAVENRPPEVRVASSAADVAQGRDEHTQRELATINNDLGGRRLVGAADCSGTGHPP